MNIFDFEQNIMNCWNVTNDIEYLSKYVGNMEGLDAKQQDMILNVLMGMHDLYEIKFNALFDNFEKLTLEYHQNKNALEELRNKKLCECPEPIDPKQTGPIKIEP